MSNRDNEFNLAGQQGSFADSHGISPGRDRVKVVGDFEEEITTAEPLIYGIEIGPESTVTAMKITSNFLSGREFVITSRTPFRGVLKGPIKVTGYQLRDTQDYVYDVIFWTQPPPVILPTVRPAIANSLRDSIAGDDIPWLEIPVNPIVGNTAWYYVGDIEDLIFRNVIVFNGASVIVQGSLDALDAFKMQKVVNEAGYENVPYRIRSENAKSTDGGSPAIPTLYDYCCPRIPFIRLRTDSDASPESPPTGTVQIWGKKRG